MDSLEVKTPEGGAEPVAGTAVQEVEYGGQKYKLPEVVEAYKTFSERKDDIGQLDKYKQDAQAFSEMERILQTKPELASQIRLAYAEMIAGKPFGVVPTTPAEKSEATPAKKEKEGMQVPPELMAEIQEIKRTQQSVMNAEGERQLQQEMGEFQSKYPMFKDKAKMDSLWKHGRDLINQRTVQGIQSGMQPNDAYAAANNFVSGLSLEQLMFSTPLRQEYETNLIQKAGGRPNLPGGIGTPAEQANNGQPGPTPELETQLLNEIKSAGLDRDKRLAAIEKYSRLTGRNPLEVYGFDPKEARQLTGG